jgi:hypothetical protein
MSKCIWLRTRTGLLWPRCEESCRLFGFLGTWETCVIVWLYGSLIVLCLLQDLQSTRDQLLCTVSCVMLQCLLLTYNMQW